MRTSKPDEWLKYEGARVLRASESGASVLVAVAGQQVWVPQSQIHADSEAYKPGTDGTLILPRWLAEDRGIEDDGEEYEP